MIGCYGILLKQINLLKFLFWITSLLSFPKKELLSNVSSFDNNGDLAINTKDFESFYTIA